MEGGQTHSRRLALDVYESYRTHNISTISIYDIYRYMSIYCINRLSMKHAFENVQRKLSLHLGL